MKSANECCVCKAEILLPDALYDAAKHSPRITFWCAYGHEQHFVQGPSEKEQLRLERDRLKQQLAEKDDDARAGWATASAQAARADKAERAAKRLKIRASAGTCPCCNRTFSNMTRHMQHKHPGFGAEPVVKLVASK